jgi:XRE family aerobic/anaerobic benzoate catabolism transcriptional regulator
MPFLRTRPDLPHDAATGPLVELGQAVRRLRKTRNWSRKTLAVASAVSERHLAQLENGRGNVSVALLSRIATALQTDLRDLFAPAGAHSVEEILVRDLIRGLPPADRQCALRQLHEQFGPANGSRRRLALVGLRGAGKTTQGRRVAARLGIPFIRLGEEIERLAGMVTSEIFSLSGEVHYRRLEERALEETLRNHDHCVIETGGSIVTRPRLLNLLLGSCFVVWLSARPEDHIQRVIDQADLRPMADHADAISDLRRILEERDPFYRQAHAHVHTSEKSIEECEEELVRIFSPVCSQRTTPR